jgi:hypothetical protein
MRLIIIHIFILLTGLVYTSSAFEECDSLIHCYGAKDRALTLTNTVGKGAHYVDVPNSPSLRQITNEMTVEMRINAQKQTGKKQFLGGLWGPADDVNDVWVIYIDENDMLVFEINHYSSKFGEDDNTIAEMDFSALYDDWQHCTFVFDGNTQSAKIYLNGEIQYATRNSTYPATHLRVLQNPDLTMQIGSTNALSNDFNNNRTFLGQLDEIRIWNKVFQDDEIYCNKDLAMYGTEDNLIMYWRCNQVEGNTDICDATPNGNHGIALAGAQCMESNWMHNRTVFLESVDIAPVGNRIKDTLSCNEVKTYRFRAIDTSSCGKSCNVRMWYDIKDKWELSVNRLDNMEKGVYYDIELTIDAKYIEGTVNSLFQVYSFNWCRYVNNIWMDITVITDTEIKTDDIDFGLLKANCVEKPYEERKVKICNITDKTANPKDIEITDFQTQFPDFFRLADNMPIIIAPGDCYDIPLRFYSADTSGIYQDTLKIITTDACDPVKEIFVMGEVQQIIVITDENDIPVDTVNFETTCVDFASKAFNFKWMNLLLEEDVEVVDIVFPEFIKSVPFEFPIILEPETGYLPEYFRFRPSSQGDFSDYVIFKIRSGECTIEWKIYVTGTGRKIDVEFEQPALTFGNAIVGQEQEQTVDIVNLNSETATLRLYVKRGEAFFINSSRIITIPPYDSKTVTIGFRPYTDIAFEDELCFFDPNCYESGCIPLTGTGVYERFVFNPEILNIENVIGCQSGEGTLIIENNLSQQQTLSNFKFTDTQNKFNLIEPPTLPNNVVLEANGTYSITFEYVPNETNFDRADRAFIEYKTEDGEDWITRVDGSSITPSIFLPERTTYGIIEYGDTKPQTLQVQNTSPVDILIDSITVPAGFVKVSPDDSFNGSFLPSGEVIDLIIEFSPTAEGFFAGDVTIYSSSPCLKTHAGRLEGTAEIIPLEIPLTLVSFGFINPCDCVTRDVLMINRSQLNDMSIDSISINGEGMTGASPQFYSWTSHLYEQGGRNLPYVVPPSSIDTLKVTYCPDTPSNIDSLVHSAKVDVFASGIGWENSFSSYLSGNRTFMVDYLTYEVNFPLTRVDTFSVPQYADFYIPDVTLNPAENKIVIDTITFTPDERVFYLDSTGLDFPVTLQNLDTILTKLQFKPRAVRDYTAKMNLNISEPCDYSDTVIILNGGGFAPAFGLSFLFENPESDTIPEYRTVHCDTLEIPLYSSRQFPADIVDVDFYMSYDTSAVKLVAIETKYLVQQCENYIPDFQIIDTDIEASRIKLKNFCRVDSVDPIIVAKFLPKVNRRDTFLISIDSLKFDTEEVILYELVVESPTARAYIELTEIEILNEPDFSTVNVLDCRTDTLFIRNNGDNPVGLSEIIDLPKYVKIIESEPDFEEPLIPGEISHIVLEYCPRNNDTINAPMFSFSSYPCIVNDSSYVFGNGFAPDYEISSDISLNFSVPDTIAGSIGDTVVIPIYSEKDLSVVYNDNKYYLEDLEFTVDFLYNQRALKFLDYSNFSNGDLAPAIQNGFIKLNYTNVDSLIAGKIAEIKFLTTVPDSIVSYIGLKTYGFETESIMFYNLIPYDQNAYFRTDGKCDLTYFNFSDALPGMVQNYPNPWSDFTEIEFTTQERANVVLTIFDSSGEIIEKPLDGSVSLSPGTYKIKLSSKKYPTGMYFYKLEAGQFEKTMKMMKLK